jgi:predicted metalloprotease with PDZ domain
LLTFFIVGDVKSYVSRRDDGHVQFGIYWLEEPPFEIKEVAAATESFFQSSTEFWQDSSTQPYRVFMRVNEESQQGNSGRGSGGTALRRSFLFGYNRQYGISDTGLITLLGHEITHNWTPWSSGTQAQQSHYNEGAAEFWSLRLLWRTGVLSTVAYLDEMNNRAARYYRNSAVNFSDEEAMEYAWQLRDAQNIPYGRGMIHFANLDAELRDAGSTSRIDDLAIEFFHVCQLMDSCGSEEWYALLFGSLGQEAVDEWELVSTGNPLIQPREGSLGPCFEVVQNGTFPTVYIWEAREGANISSPECQL